MKSNFHTNANSLRDFRTSLMALFLLTPVSVAYASEDLSAQSVWSPEIASMYETASEPPDWLQQPTEQHVVVRGLANNSTESPRNVAIREHLLPQLRSVWGESWDDGKVHLVERELGCWLDRSERVKETFVQPYYKVVDDERYPAFTREAWLVDLSDLDYESLARRIDARLHTITQRQRFTIGMSVFVLSGVFAFCWIVTTVLDRITRGYYTGRLRTMAAVFFVSCAAVTFHLARTVLQNL